MKTRFIMLSILAMSFIFFAGCNPPFSVNPFYTDKDVVFDEDLLGMWLDESEEPAILFTQSEENKYHAEWLMPWESVFYTAHLFKIKDKLYLDMHQEGGQGRFDDDVFPRHTILKVEKNTRDKLNLLYIEIGKLSNYLKSNPDAVSHTYNWDDEKANVNWSGILILTAQTKELQDFIFKIRDNKELFETIKLFRKMED